MKRGFYKPHMLRFWKREVGALWLPFEQEQIKDFCKVKANEKITISGYVKWITDRTFALLPTLFSNQIYLLCLNCTDHKPSENAYITISGTTKWTRIRRPLQAPTYSRIYKGEIIVYVYNWIDSKPKFQIPKTNFEFKDFKEDLTYRIEGLEPKIVDFLAFTAISTPMFYENIGGVNLTLYDSTKSGLPKLVLRELRRVIPSDIGRLYTVKTPFGKFGMRYKYASLTINADQPLSNIAKTFLVHRTREYITEYDESSLSLFSAQEKPRTIEDPPCSSSDVPTVVPEETTIIRKRSDPDFDSFKYMIINQMKAPVIQDYDSSLVHVVNNLEKLRESWGLNSAQLTQYGFLNANYNARPTSVVRKSLAYARVQDVDVVSPQEVSKVFKEYFEWNFGYVYEIWEDLLKPGKEISLSLRVKYRDIIRIIRKHETTNALGVSRETIIAEAKTPPVKTNLLINDCVRDGIIYEPVKGFYRLTHG